MSKIQLPLQAICLLTSGATLKDIKAEMLLFIIRDFLYEYLTQNNTNSHILIVAKNDEEYRRELDIKELATKIFDYLDQNVLSRRKLKSVFAPTIMTKEAFRLAKQNEPIGFYHNAIAKAVEEVLKDIQAYIPEILAFEMLRIFLEEDGKQIPKHKFFNDINLDVVFTYYDEKNIELKRQINPNERLWNIKTPIGDAYKLAGKIMARYNKTSYKINTNRVSKTRKK